MSARREKRLRRLERRVSDLEGMMKRGEIEGAFGVVHGPEDSAAVDRYWAETARQHQREVDARMNRRIAGAAPVLGWNAEFVPSTRPSRRSLLQRLKAAWKVIWT